MLCESPGGKGLRAAWCHLLPHVKEAHLLERVSPAEASRVEKQRENADSSELLNPVPQSPQSCVLPSGL